MAFRLIFFSLIMLVAAPAECTLESEGETQDDLEGTPVALGLRTTFLL